MVKTIIVKEQNLKTNKEGFIDINLNKYDRDKINNRKDIYVWLRYGTRRLQIVFNDMKGVNIKSYQDTNLIVFKSDKLSITKL